MLKKIALVITGLIAAAALVLALWYQIDGQPLEEASRFLDNESFSVIAHDDGAYTLVPAEANGAGLVIMHGALIYPMSYANSAAYFAARGYTVILPYGTARLSINATEQAASQATSLATSQEIKRWFLIGHSMGGMASLELARKHDLNIKAIALWAAAIPGDYSETAAPILYLYGDTDGLLPEQSVDESKSLLPEKTQFMKIAGANHKDFAMYSHQFFDNESLLGWQQQIQRANVETEKFFADQP